MPEVPPKTMDFLPLKFANANSRKLIESDIVVESHAGRETTRAI
jgi:hypothetical protein